VDGKNYPIPINRKTLNDLYQLELDEAGAQAYLDSVREKRENIITSEDLVLNSVGRDLCEKFFRGYTKKQWGLDLSDLVAGVAARIPTRTNDDDRYFTDKYQFMPLNGYTEMFKRILANPRIKVQTSTSLEDVKTKYVWDHMIYTGPIDAFFGYCYGRLPYRSLYFHHEHIRGVPFLQDVGTVNYPNDHEYTRITEFKHLTGQKCSGTSVVREYPQSNGDPYYPIPTLDNESLCKLYKELTETEKRVTFIGRLAEYKYYNMDQVVASALSGVSKLIST
jgi:UDP-galactopyranose mutase